MKILALETGGEAGSVALAIDDDVFDLHADVERPSSGWVLPAVARALAEGGITLRALDAIAFAAGPGAFTGLRLACGVAQGLAFASDRPVVAVGSLEALAWQAGEGLRIVALDARMNEVYFAAYRVTSDTLETLLAPECAPPEAAGAQLAAYVSDAAARGAGPWAAAGNGFAAMGGVLAQPLAGCVSGVDATLMPTARAVAHLAARAFMRGEAVSAAQAAPIYVRDKVARTIAERVAAGGRA